MNSHSFTRGLAFFSFGLGVAELLAPRKVGQLIGVRGHDGMIRALGLREIGSGLGIMQGNPSAFLWSRVAGDALDLGLLAAARRSNRHDQRRLNVAIAAVAGVTILDVIASVLRSRSCSEPQWRDSRPMAERAGLNRADPRALRASADEAMARYGVKRDVDEPAPEAPGTASVEHAPAQGTALNPS